jgi:hypothetical protein
MFDDTTAFTGPDVHKDSITAACVEADPDGLVEGLATIVFQVLGRHSFRLISGHRRHRE